MWKDTSHREESEAVSKDVSHPKILWRRRAGYEAP